MSALEIHVIVTEEAKAEFAAKCVAAVKRVTGFDLDTLIHPCRLAHVVAARRALIWLLVEVAQMSYSAIGRLLQQDHTTVRASHLRALQGQARSVIVTAIADVLGSAPVG